MILSAITHTLELVTTTTAQIDYVVDYVDHTTSGGTLGSAQGTISTATTTVILAAPAASTQRQIRRVSARNSGTVAQVVTLVKDVSAVNYNLTGAITLGVGSCLVVDVDGRAQVLDAQGRTRIQAVEDSGYSGRSVSMFANGTPPEAVGIIYGWWKDSGLPGAWNPGTPGVDGRVTDGTAAADAGCLPWVNAASGAMYLTDFRSSLTVSGMTLLWDVLWVNSGLVVTTTTLQAIASPVWPARDLNGATAGEGIGIAIIITTATTNVGGFSNMTLSYTNSDGTAGRTATMASFPATAVIGTVVRFQLQAGDKGVRSVQGITLGSSLAAGAVSLIAYRDVALNGSPIANVGQLTPFAPQNPGVRLYNGTCILPFLIPSQASSTNLHALVTIMER